MVQGNLTAAGHWADNSGLSPNDLVGYRREYEYLVLARVLIAKRSEAVLLLLTRLLENAEANDRLGSAIEILALRALAHQALGDKMRALQDLERALAIGEPEGYVRVFVDAGAAMATLLRWGRARGVAPEYCTRLLNAFGHRATENTPPGFASDSVPQSLSTGTGPSTPVAEPLTAREADVLQLLVQGASNREIAQRLFLTTSTVKKHLNHIFGKLDVRSRAQLIARSSGFESPKPQRSSRRTVHF